MAGGIFEGIKKCYKGKNVLSKHIFLVILLILVTLPSLIATLNTDGSEIQVYKYLFIEHLYLGVIILAGSLILGIYMIHFIHNCVKYFLWKDTQNDQAKVEAMEILPNVDLNIFKHFWKWVGFWTIWLVFLLAICIVLGAICVTPIVNFVGIPLMLLFMVAVSISMPYITIGFARNYSIKGNISPHLLFTYLPKIFVPAIILSLKYFGISILYGIGVVLSIVVVVAIGTVGTIMGFKLTSTVPVILISTAMMYVTTILGLAYYYAASKIYYDKIELEKEI